MIRYLYDVYRSDLIATIILGLNLFFIVWGAFTGHFFWFNAIAFCFLAVATYISYPARKREQNDRFLHE